MSVVVTVTQPGVTITAPPSTSTPSSAAAGVIAGIVIGTLLGGILFIALVLYLFTWYYRRTHKFTKVSNPTHVENAADLRYMPKSTSGGTKHVSLHSQRPSISTEPLIPPASWPPQSTGSPHCSIASRTSLPPPVTIIVDMPEQTSSGSPRLGTPPHARQQSGDDTTSQKSQRNLFIYRMLQSRAKALDDVAPEHRPSSDLSQNRSTTAGAFANRDQLFVDVEMAQRNGERILPGRQEEDDWEEVQSIESSYSQLSAPADHSTYFSDSVSFQNNSVSLPRRKSSRRQARTSALPELPPVAEVPDTTTSSSLEGKPQSHRMSTAANSSLDVQVSHGTESRSMSSVLDPSGPLPLLTSVNFGKDSSTSGTPPGSLSSSTGWASSSNGRTSRYPSLAASSIAQSSRSGPRSDAGTDWHNLPTGLAGLASLQIGPLTNPHSPVEEQPEQAPELLGSHPAETTPAKRARLREGTTSSIPEVERRTVMQGGIAHIDVAL